MKRRQFNKALAAASAAAAVSPFGILHAQAQKLRVGVLLPRSGFQGFIGQSCQKGADLAPGVIKEILGVDIELMHADTETNVDTARTRAERLIQEGAHVLVGPFDSGAAAAIAQVAEQRGVPFVINIAAAPQITEEGYKYVFRNFQTAIDIVRNGLDLIGDLFQATNTVPRTAVFMHVNDTFGQAMAKGIGALLPRRTQLPFKIVDSISYDPAAKDLTVEVSKAKASNADFLLLVCRLNDGSTFEAILDAAAASTRAKSTDPKTLADAPRQTNITEKMTRGGPIKFNEKGQVEGIGSACVQNLNLTPTVVLPANAATAKPVFPAPYYKKA